MILDLNTYICAIFEENVIGPYLCKSSVAIHLLRCSQLFIYVFILPVLWSSKWKLRKKATLLNKPHGLRTHY